MASRSKLLRLRSFRRAALRGLAWVLLIGLLGAPLLAWAGLAWVSITAIALAIGLSQALAGLLEVAAEVAPEDAREWQAARVGLSTGVVTFLGVVLALAQARAAPHLIGGRTQVALLALRGLPLELALNIAMPAALLIACATWVRHGPERRSHKKLIAIVCLLALPFALLLLATGEPSLMIVALPATFIGSTVLLVVSTLLAGLHAWLDRVERRALPPLPDE